MQIPDVAPPKLEIQPIDEAEEISRLKQILVEQLEKKDLDKQSLISLINACHFLKNYPSYGESLDSLNNVYYTPSENSPIPDQVNGYLKISLQAAQSRLMLIQYQNAFESTLK